MPGTQRSMLRRVALKLTTTSSTSSPSFITSRALRGAGSAINRRGTYPRASPSVTYAPWLEYDSTIAETDEPTGCRSTKPRKGSRSLTMCGRAAVGASVCSAGCRFRSAPRTARLRSRPRRRRPERPTGDRADREPERPFAPGGGAVGTGIGCEASLLARPPVRPGPAARTGRALGGLPRVLDGPPADRAPHRHPGHEDPAHVGHRLAADEPALVEQPVVVAAVELLVRVVRQDGGLDLVGDREHEGVTAPDGPGRRGHELVVLDGGVELGHLPRVDPMAERGVHDDGDDVVGVLLHEREDGLVELLEARQRSPFGGEVRAVDDDVSWHTGLSVNHLDTANDGIAAPGERGAGRPPTLPPRGERRPVGLRRGHPDQPVRGLRPLRARAGPARGLHPPGQRHQPPRQRVGPPRARESWTGPASPSSSAPRRGRWAARSPASACWSCWPGTSGRRW